MTAKQNKTVMVVDDEYEYRNVLKIQLSDEGFTVIDFENGEKAVEYLKEHTDESVGLVILDQFMPFMDGQTFLYHLKNTIKKDIPVLLLTNYDNVAHQEGIKECVVKSSINLDDLVAKVKQYTGAVS
jgi:two-component system response regulator ResD